MNNGLAGRRVLVTGGSSGIGRAIALSMAREGCRVVVADRAPDVAIETVVNSMQAAGGDDGFGVQTDVSSEDEIVAFFDKIRERLGGLDVLVNNAGILIDKPPLETTMADFDRLIGVNLRGAFLVGREALRLMTAQGTGRVINVASELAYVGRANCSLYCASKGGVLSMTRAWAREFAPAILVNALAPGPTDTPLLAPESMTPEMRAKEADNPLGRIAHVHEIAATAVFLAGDGATFMTGQCVSPNGGAAMF